MSRLPVRISSGDKESTGTALLEIWDQGERKRRGLKGLVICWCIAVATIFLPLVHFVAVPVFAVLGPFVYLHVIKQPGRVVGIEATCPFCQKPLSVANAKMEWPLRLVCASCFEPLRVEKSG